jgi:hypothetical protein
MEHKGSRDSSAGIATVSGLDGRGSSPGRGKKYFSTSFQTGSGTHQASYPTGTGDSFRG